jgi:hypothetical protein
MEFCKIGMLRTQATGIVNGIEGNALGRLPLNIFQIDRITGI